MKTIRSQNIIQLIIFRLENQIVRKRIKRVFKSVFQVPNIQPMCLKFDENMTRNSNKRVRAFFIKQSLYCFREMRIKDMQI